MPAAEDVMCARFSSACKPSLKNARIFAGFGKADASDPDIRKLDGLLEETASECAKSFPVLACWKTFVIMHDTHDDGGIRLKGSELVLPGNSVSRHLSKATHAVLIAVTLGMDSERELKRRYALGATEGHMFSACASSLVESGADLVQAEVERRLSKCGFEACGFRYSPGYGDLPLEIQPAFLETLDARKGIGLYTTEGNALVPTKSITAILPVRPVRG